jgi:hypothetical protein
MGIPSALVTVELTADIDQPTMEGQIQIYRGKPEQSLSPLISPGPYRLWPGQDFRLWVACLPPEIQWTNDSFSNSMPLARCKIDNIDIAADETSMRVSFRDAGAYFLNSWIKASYTQPGGAVQTVMRQIINAAGMDADTGITSLVSREIYTPEDPGWILNTYPQEEMSVLEALRTLALQIGWDIRWRTRFEGGGVGDGLVLRPPDLNGGLSQNSFGTDQIIKYTQMSVGDEDIRNQVEVWYGGDQRLLYYKEDAASMAQFGNRWMRIVEEKSSNINTEAEAARMATQALSDLSQPVVTYEVEMRFWPFVELGDMYVFYPDYIHFSSPQLLAVVGYTHSIGLESSRTRIRCRGQPAASNANWRGGKPQTIFVSVNDPVGPAPEHSTWYKVESLDFPAP